MSTFAIASKVGLDAILYLIPKTKYLIPVKLTDSSLSNYYAAIN